MIQSAATYNPYLMQAAPLRPQAPPPETDPIRAAEKTHRPVNPAEASRRENWRRDTREETEPQGELLQADPRIERFIAHAEQAGQSALQTNALGGEMINGRAGNDYSSAEVNRRDSASGFGDLYLALSYWESLDPRREDTTDLPAPVAAYREVEAGPPPRLGLSVYA